MTTPDLYFCADCELKFNGRRPPGRAGEGGEAMTSRPTVEPAGVSEERLRAIDSGRIKSGHALATEHEIRRMASELLAARQQLAELRVELCRRAAEEIDLHGRLVISQGQLAEMRGALLSAYRHMQSTGAHESYLSPQRALLVQAGYLFDDKGYYIAALAPTSQPSQGHIT